MSGKQEKFELDCCPKLNVGGENVVGAKMLLARKCCWRENVVGAKMLLAGKCCWRENVVASFDFLWLCFKVH
jgi:hypothetical protein